MLTRQADVDGIDLKPVQRRKLLLVLAEAKQSSSSEKVTREVSQDVATPSHTPVSKAFNLGDSDSGVIMQGAFSVKLVRKKWQAANVVLMLQGEDAMLVAVQGQNLRAATFWRPWLMHVSLGHVAGLCCHFGLGHPAQEKPMSVQQVRSHWC